MLPVQSMQESRHDRSPGPKPSVPNDLPSEPRQSLESPRKLRQGRSGSYGSVQQIAKALMEDDEPSTPNPTPLVDQELCRDLKPSLPGGLFHEDNIVEEQIHNRHALAWEESEPPEESKPLYNHLAKGQRNPENRRSSAERFSSIALPPLKEEATPTSSPASTLPRQQTQHAVIPREPSDFDHIPANKLEKVQDEESSDGEESGARNVASSKPTPPQELLINFSA
jgi:hypothetical protein